MKKFAAFAAAFVLLLSVFLVPSFAEDREFLSDAPLRDVQTSAPFDIFDISYYSYSGAFSDLQTTSVSPPVFTYLAFYDSNGNYITSLSGAAHSVWRGVKTINGVSYRVVYYDLASQYLVINLSSEGSPSWVGYSDSSSLTLGGSSVSGILVESNPTVQIGSSIFSVGSAFISFVTANWLTLLPVTAFVVVLAFGVIRRLVKGV